MNKLQKAKDILKKYNQEHLLYFYEELNEEEREYLINQIFDIDFDEIFKLYEASKKDPVISQKSIEPLPYVDKSSLSKSEIARLEDIGRKIIEKGEYAVVTMAGGQRNKIRI